MKKTVVILFAFLLMSFQPEATVKIGLLKYSGGGDWYSNPTSLPNLIEFCNINLGMNLVAEPVTIEAGNPEIFNLPLLHMTGHGNVVFSADELKNLRQYLLAGGFLHIDDNYGMDPFVRQVLKELFPDKELVEIPFNHDIYDAAFRFTNGLPKIHEHDNKPPQGFGIFNEGRLLVFYSYECDLGDGWEDQDVHNDPENIRQLALQMGANIVKFAFEQ